MGEEVKKSESSVFNLINQIKTTAVKEFLEEKYGCIYFIDVWDNQNKVCGIYQIKKY